MMGFFRNETGSRLVKNNTPTATEQEAAIPVVTDTVEEDVSAAYAQQDRQRRGLKSTLVNKQWRANARLVDHIEGNTTLG